MALLSPAKRLLRPCGGRTGHYARAWELPSYRHFFPVDLMNKLGIDYVEAPDPAAKEAVLLEICQRFHP